MSHKSMNEINRRDPLSKEGQPIKITELRSAHLSSSEGNLSALISGELSGIRVKEAISEHLLAHAVDQMLDPKIYKEFCSPNLGMKGGELLTLGAAATPTFTALNGPSEADYLESVASSSRWHDLFFEGFDFRDALSELFSLLDGGRRSVPAPYLRADQSDTGEYVEAGEFWLPFNYRILPPGEQIYTHHDNHYRLPIYQYLPERYDRSVVLSWFITAQAPSEGGELVMYGLSGDAPEVPMLPTRFVDTAALESRYHKHKVACEPGELFIFNSKAHIHRVSPVIGERSRITIGGFMTVDREHSGSIYWS